MHKHYLLGIDGGGTHCRARLTDYQGLLLAESHSSSANVFNDFSSATTVLNSLIETVFTLAGLDEQARASTIIVAGLAGANVASVSQALAEWRSPVSGFYGCSDVEIACMGAHQGTPGAVLIVGTGSQGAAWDGERFTSLGGWGFALADHGSGADLGRRALRHALLAHEDIIPATDLTRQLMQEFDNSPETLLLWTRKATTACWARFAPAVFAAANDQDAAGITLVAETARDIGLLIDKLRELSQGNIALMGGIARPILPWLPDAQRERITPARGDALSGALLMARHYASTTASQFP